VSGWAVVHSEDAELEAPWARALGWLLDVDVFSAGEGPWRLAAWRRKSGEFPESGRLHEGAGGLLAWVGQTLEDSGDSSKEAIALLQGCASDEQIAGLNGPFAAARIHSRERSPQRPQFDGRITVWTDRYRQYPVYVHRRDGLVAASTDVRCVIAFVDRPRVDEGAVDLFLRTGELIDRRTLIAGVEILPPGTELSLRDGTLRERRYWRLRHEPERGRRPEDWADELGGRMQAAVRRIEGASPRLGVTLSGGLDSRLILGLCAEPRRVPSFTWGLPGCRDIACARAFARRVGSPHTVQHWEPEKFVPLWPRGVALTVGGTGIENMYMLPFVGLLAEHADVVLNGLAGDVFLGGNFLKLGWIREQSISGLAEKTWRWRVSAEQDAQVDGLTGRRGEARQQWMESIAREGASGRRPIERLHDWLHENRLFRSTNAGTMLLRDGLESHAPFFDRDVVDALLRTPMELKHKHRLYLRMLKRWCPAAAAVPWQRTAIPPGWGVTAMLASLAFHRGARAALRPLGVKPFKSLAVADPSGWLRGPWRDAAASIVLDEETLSRSWVNAEVLRNIFKGHQDGVDATRVLSGVITVELACRALMEGNTVTRSSSQVAGAWVA
jgi:asparagine synthase (glutamine-hydrolysing)